MNSNIQKVRVAFKWQTNWHLNVIFTMTGHFKDCRCNVGLVYHLLLLPPGAPSLGLKCKVDQKNSSGLQKKRKEYRSRYNISNTIHMSLNPLLRHLNRCFGLSWVRIWIYLSNRDCSHKRKKNRNEQITAEKKNIKRNCKKIEKNMKRIWIIKKEKMMQNFSPVCSCRNTDTGRQK